MQFESKNMRFVLNEPLFYFRLQKETSVSDGAGEPIIHACFAANGERFSKRDGKKIVGNEEE